MKSSGNAESRITILRNLLGYSQKEFATKASITQSALSQLEAGKTRLSWESLRKISEEFNVNCNWLVQGKGNIFEEDAKDQKVKFRDRIVTRDKTDNNLIPLVKEEAFAGYIKGHKETAYIETLDVYRIPGFETGNYRLFEIKGDSMIPALYPRELVVCEYVDNWENIENGTICIVLSRDGIVAKRTFFYEEDRQNLILKSDNASFKTYSMHLKEVLEIWVLKSKITSIFVQEAFSDTLESLKSDIQELRDQMRLVLTTAKISNGK